MQRSNTEIQTDLKSDNCDRFESTEDKRLLEYCCQAGPNPMVWSLSWERPLREVFDEWLGREAIFICCDATEETEPEFSVAGNTMQIWWENNHCLVKTLILLQKQEAFCTFNERDTLTFNNWSLIIALHTYNVYSKIKGPETLRCEVIISV